MPTKYSPAFKRYAVNLYLNTGAGIAACAERLAVPVSTLDYWVRSKVGTVSKPVAA